MPLADPALSREPRALSAIAAVRRAQAARPEADPIGGVDAGREALRLRPALDLAFPAGEVEAVRERPDGRIELELALPALYGTGSPLPAYATERLLGLEREAARELIDIVNHRLLSLTLRVAGRRELEPERRRAERVAGYVGLGSCARRLRWAGLLRGARAAEDLEALLADLCAPHPLRLEQNAPTDTILPAEARARLAASGCVLGVDAVIGESVANRATAFRVRVGPLPAALAACFAPAAELHRELADAVELFAEEPLDWELELLIDGATLGAASLDGGAALAGAARLDGCPAAAYPVRIHPHLGDPWHPMDLLLRPCPIRPRPKL